MIGYGPGHVKALDQISMVQRGRTTTHPLTVSFDANTRNRRQPSYFLHKSLTRILDTLYHFELAQLWAGELRAAPPVRRDEQLYERLP
ncbi:hypothetical protein R70006_07177 [Paraburkholderia domus]|nr:hypothetical protein R70006_07177 [Paraburkholderia domus]